MLGCWRVGCETGAEWSGADSGCARDPGLSVEVVFFDNGIWVLDVGAGLFGDDWGCL